ncbi:MULTISPECIES: chemotaxis protein CheW [unclassified Xanthobacter]|uniref:hybrid sensor histidine kinase/response regulator n=1 Tax=unclassified Xanthobacter TaxID=2623496 RepID=UPI001F19CA80|nr:MULTISPECIES: chemotaxis protein CheW [unclassified Xanthobacter]
MDDLLQEFLTETNESLDVADVELVKFEQDPNNAEILNNIFRLVHTIKGTCGFIGLSRLAAVAHAAETLMGKFRDGRPVTADAVTLVLSTIDRIKWMLSAIEENNGQEPEGNDQDLISLLEEMAATELPPPEPEPVPEPPKVEAAPQTLERDLLPGEIPLDELERLFRETEVELPARGKDKAKEAAPAASAAASSETTASASSSKGDSAKGDSSKSDAPKAEPPAEPKAATASVPAPVTTSGAIAKADGRTPATQGGAQRPSGTPSGVPANAEEGTHASALSAQTIRVSVGVLEQLMTMVSELVLTRNQLMEIARRQGDSEYKVSLQRLSNVTGELQDAVMRARMQPIGNAWQKLPRIVRDLGQELGKQIELEQIGADTELDRQVLDQIKDPLTHMVRNSADHGLETPEERRAAGKPERGTIRLSAYHEGGHVIVEIADDGRGLNVGRIKQKIVERGLATEAEVSKMPDVQAFRYIFQAGFSTAEKVTSVSGRGVGMDVVRTNIEAIGGTIEVHSKLGQGSAFVIKIPLTLAIVPALIVRAADERFALPQSAVVELVRVQPGTDHAVNWFNNVPVLCLRDKLLPIVALGTLLGLAPEQDAHQADQWTDALIVVLRVGAETFGVVVDAVSHTEEIVVKPMSSTLRQVPMVSGCTILGDGRVIMIVDPAGLAQGAAARGAEAAEMDLNTAEATHRAAAAEERTSLLLFRAGSREPKAVPLGLVTRIEELEVSSIERVKGYPVIQYRGALIPVLYANEEVGRAKSGTQPMLVFSAEGRVMGLLVDEIVDIVETPLDMQLSPSGMPEVLGAAVISGQATEILDVGFYINVAFGERFEQLTRVSTRPKLLLVDDSAFHRDLLAPVLKGNGYDVTTCSSAQEALERLGDDEEFDAIISDLELPDMDGFALAAAVRDDPRNRDLPIIAVSASRDRDTIERGRAAGFTDYVARYDRAGLIEALKEFAGRQGAAA